MHWGFSEAVDFHEEFEKIRDTCKEPISEMNILLLGCSDPRHIIKTLAKSFKHQTKFNIYVIEPIPTLIARQMLLLSIALEAPNCLTTLAKTHIFMDIFGNTLIRPTSAAYVHSKAIDFINYVTDSDSLQHQQSIFDLTHIKYIERDLIVDMLNFWRAKEENNFNVAWYWEQRTRKHLGARYDHRQGIFDWDHQMRLKDNGAQQICSQEYRHWRETGIAFTFPEYRQTHANKTFAVDISNHSNNAGYVGDIVVGPFAPFGLKCDDCSYLKSFYGQNEYRATDLTERNLFQLFYEIEEQQPFNAQVFRPHQLGSAKLDNGRKPTYIPTEASQSELRQFAGSLVRNDRISVIYSSMKDFDEKFSRYFDVVFIGCNYLQRIKPSISQSFALHSLVLFETIQYTTQRKENVDAFLQKVQHMASGMNLTACTKLNINLPVSIVRYKYEASQ